MNDGYFEFMIAFLKKAISVNFILHNIFLRFSLKVDFVLYWMFQQKLQLVDILHKISGS